MVSIKRYFQIYTDYKSGKPGDAPDTLSSKHTDGVQTQTLLLSCEACPSSTIWT